MRFSASCKSSFPLLPVPPVVRSLPVPPWFDVDVFLRLDPLISLGSMVLPCLYPESSVGLNVPGVGLFLAASFAGTSVHGRHC